MAVESKARMSEEGEGGKSLRYLRRRGENRESLFFGLRRCKLRKIFFGPKNRKHLFIFEKHFPSSKKCSLFRAISELFFGTEERRRGESFSIFGSKYRRLKMGKECLESSGPQVEDEGFFEKEERRCERFLQRRCMSSEMEIPSKMQNYSKKLFSPSSQSLFLFSKVY